jgi:hypothetical protein
MPVWMFWTCAAGLIGGACVVSLDAAPTRTGYPDVPIPGHTGGFSEPTCQTCHFDGELNPGGGELSVQGWPDRALPDSTYRLVVSVRHEELVLGGFQAAIRYKDGSPSGTLEPADVRSMAVEGQHGARYIQHSYAGTEPTADGEASWEILWTAPKRSGKAVLHLVANAANGDRSEFGDHIFADSLQTTIRR